MRILYSHRIQSRDGQAVHLEEMVAAMRQAGHEVCVVGPALQEEGAAASQRMARVRRLLPGALGELAELAYNIIAIRRLGRAWRAFGPDVVYERYNLFHFAGAWLARRYGVLLYMEINSPLAAERARHGGLRLQALARWVERITWQSASRVFPVTAVLGRIVAASGVDPGRITVIPNAVVPARYPATQQPPGPPLLGFVGFMREWHGLGTVLDAMAAEAMPLNLVLVGDGPVRPALERQAQALGLGERVRFLGLVSPEQVPGLVSGFTIALQPRVTDYASPLKVFDYMAAGCAIVAPDQPNICEVLTHGVTALLFDPDEPGAMWAAVRRLVQDDALRERLGQAARARALSRHTWLGNAQRVAALAAEDGAVRRPEPVAAALGAT